MVGWAPRTYALRMPNLASAPGHISGMPPALARRWVMSASLIAAFGYAAMALSTFANQRAGGTHALANMIPASFLCIAAYVAARQGRALTGGALIVVTVWVQTQLSYTYTYSVPMPGMLVTPVVVVGTALLVGARWSLVMALVSIVIAWPFTLWSPAMRDTGMTADGAYWLALHSIVVMVAWGLVSMALATIERNFAELRAKEADLRETIRVAPDGILVVDAARTVVMANPAAGVVLGQAPESCEGRSLSEVLDRAGFSSPVPTDALESMPHDARLMWTTQRRSGEELHVELAWGRMAGGRRQLILHDASERIRTEKARHVMELQLAHKQRLESIGLLAAGIAHDFNNILTVVGGCGEMLQRGTGDASAPILVSEILAAHERGTALTQQLLSFARRDQAQPVVVELSAHIGGLERFLQRVAGEEVRIILRLASEAFIRIDVGQLEQALVNLVSNARDAMPDGGDCVVSVETATDAEGDARVRLSVRDTGIGMDAETIERAFDPFFTTKTRGRGTGLGLAVLHGAVMKAGGRVSIDSVVGRGTTVSLDFPPASQAAVTSAMVDQAGASAPMASGCILVVEDDDATRLVAGRMLTSLGHTVLLASGGEAALRLAHAHRDEVVLLLTDVMMPGMRGPEVALRVLETVPGLPVLFMSGYPGDALSAVPGLRLETDFIPKPFSIDVLERMIGAKLAASRLRGG